MSDRRYHSREWRRKAAAQIQAEALCRKCLERGETKLARVADHVIPHRGDAQLFWHGELQSLCVACHNKLKQREEIRGHTDDLDGEGWPTDPRHRANVRR